nr:S24 family peptidase [uncultured Sphingomonas sp.]
MGDKIIPAETARELIARLCAERNEDFATLSRLIGRNSAYVQQFVRRGTPRRLPERERGILARHFGVPEHLLGAEKEDNGAVGFTVLPPLEPEQEERGAGVAYTAEWLGELAPGGAEGIRWHRVHGDAMAPTLSAGDDLLVDLGIDAAWMPDGLYVLRIDGAAQVRRLMFHPVRKEVTVQSDNPAYVDWPGLKPAELDVIGRVVWAGRRLF